MVAFKGDPVTDDFATPTSVTSLRGNPVTNHLGTPVHPASLEVIPLRVVSTPYPGPSFGGYTVLYNLGNLVPEIP